jgi:hypothetical protein
MVVQIRGHQLPIAVPLQVVHADRICVAARGNELTGLERPQRIVEQN